MKLLIATWEFPPRIGGAGEHLKAMSISMADRGHQILLVVTSRTAANSPVQHENIDYSVHHAEKPGARYWMTAGRHIAGVAKTWKPDYVIPGDDSSIVACGFIGRMSSPLLPLFYGSEIVMAAGSQGLKAMVKRWAMRRVGRNSCGALVISPYTRSLLEDTSWFAHRPIHVLLCAIEQHVMDTPNNSDEGVRLIGPKKMNFPTVLSIARLVPRKGHDIALQAMSILKRENIQLHYVIAGDGPHENYLKGLTSQLGLQDDVTFTGRVTEQEKLSLLDQCDIFLLPSREEEMKVEGFGIVFLEAAARRKPSIGGRHGGVPSAILDGETGLLVDPHDPHDVASNIRMLFNDRARMIQLGENGHRWCKEHMLWSIRAAELEALLQKMQGRPNSTRAPA